MNAVRVHRDRPGDYLKMAGPAVGVMLVALEGPAGEAPEYFSSVEDAVDAVRPAPSALPGKEG